MQRKLIHFTGLGLALACLFLLTGSIRGDAQFHRAVNLGNPSANLPFSDGIVAGNTLYVSGTQGQDAQGKLPEGIGPQTRATLETIAKVLNQAGYSMKDVVSVTIYLAELVLDQFPCGA